MTWPAPTPCKSCRSAMCWAVTTARKRIPLDADADGQPIPWPDDAAAGRIQEEHRELTLDGGAEVIIGLTVHVLAAGEPADPELPIWRSHFATCTDAKAHRRRRP